MDRTGPNTLVAEAGSAAAHRGTRLALLLAALPPLFWAGNFLVARAMRDAIPPFQMSFWRWALAFVILIPFSWSAARKEGARLRLELPFLAVLGLVGVTAFNCFVYAALQHTDRRQRCPNQLADAGSDVSLCSRAPPRAAAGATRPGTCRVLRWRCGDHRRRATRPSRRPNVQSRRSPHLVRADLLGRLHGPHPMVPDGALADPVPCRHGGSWDAVPSAPGRLGGRDDGRLLVVASQPARRSSTSRFSPRFSPTSSGTKRWRPLAPAVPRSSCT